MKHVCGLNTKSDLTGVEPEDIQPNAVDLRLGKVFKILPEVFEIENEYKRHRGSYEIMPDSKGVFYLEPGHYEVIMENKITVGVREAGWVITRSSLNRNGLFLTSGLYDSGYSGVMAGVLHVTIGPAKIRKGTRIGQYLSFDAEMLNQYNGSYGSKSEHDKKYN
jgi:deoxycytidine triphosphate deaminase